MKHSLAFINSLLLRLAAVSLLLSGPVAYGEDKPAGSGRVFGTVVETTNAASYTYVQVDTGKEKIWAAAPHFEVKVGDKISFFNDMPMKNFQSKTLNRTFETVYFVEKVDALGTARTGTTASQAPQPAPNDEVHASLHHPAVRTNPPVTLDFSGIRKADGGLTVAEIYQQKHKLEKKQVTFRGKVVKFSSQVMNKNWAHVRDGTGTQGANDVTVTTADTAQVGDTVLVTGTVVLSKDYGYGYKYDLLLENAKVKVETKGRP